MKETRWYYSEKALQYSGTSKNLEQRQDGALDYKLLRKDALFITDIYYNDDNDLTWNTFSLEISDNAAFRVYIKFFLTYNELEKYYKCVEIEEKYKYFKDNADIVSDYGDILLYSNDNKGMYIGACIYFYQSEKNMCFNGFSISYPKSNFVSYLPALYHGNAKLEKYMAVLENVYLMLEKEIDHLPYKLDIDLAEGKDLENIFDMLDFDAQYLPDYYSKDDLRTLLKEWVMLNRVKGSVYYYKRIIEIFTKSSVVIADENLIILSDKDIISGMFYVFYNGDVKYNKWVNKYLEIERPLFSMYKLIDINNDKGLDKQCYLGISSILG